jgi:hypothetical protein
MERVIILVADIFGISEEEKPSGESAGHSK